MFKVGDKVAVHYKNDRVINETLAFGHALFDYTKHSSFKRCEVLKVKRHWNWFFKTMFLLSDGFWYSQKQLTPIVRINTANCIELETLYDCDPSPNCKKFDERVK